MAYRNSSSSFPSPVRAAKTASSAGMCERRSLALMLTAAVSCGCVSGNPSVECVKKPRIERRLRRCVPRRF